MKRHFPAKLLIVLENLFFHVVGFVLNGTMRGYQYFKLTITPLKLYNF